MAIPLRPSGLSCTSVPDWLIISAMARRPNFELPQPKAEDLLADRRRKPAVDWFFRGVWILVILALLGQFGVMAWLSF